MRLLPVTGRREMYLCITLQELIKGDEMSTACRTDVGDIKWIRTLLQKTERKNTEKRFERFVSVGKIGLNGI